MWGPEVPKTVKLHHYVHITFKCVQLAQLWHKNYVFSRVPNGLILGDHIFLIIRCRLQKEYNFEVVQCYWFSGTCRDSPGIPKLLPHCEALWLALIIGMLKMWPFKSLAMMVQALLLNSHQGCPCINLDATILCGHLDWSPAAYTKDA